MIKRFLLDWIYAEAGAASIGVQDQLTTVVLPHKAKSEIAILQRTCSRTEFADDASVFLVPPASAMFGLHRYAPRFNFTTPVGQ
jgi:hypothetical protein